MALGFEPFCRLLVRSGLLTPPEVEKARHRWTDGARTVGSADHFAAWLVANRSLTAYQARRLLRGRLDCLYLNRYRILARVGEGPVARVYRAAAPDGSVVAIKVLPPSRAGDAHLLACFVHEGHVGRILNHPNVVRTLAAGGADGLHYIVLEYLDGETLEETLRRRGQLPPAEAVRLMRQAFLGLQHIHERGLVHGNLAPANLMVAPRPRRGRPDTTLHALLKILDVGLGTAFIPEAARVATAAVGATGQPIVPLPVDDLAPEQILDPQGSDIRADIYSLGCVLYHCLTGRPPFADTSAVRQVLRHATEPPPSLREFDATIPYGLERVVERLLAKEPADRYRTPGDAARALEPFLRGVG
jgi:serine/threonine protein kinase